MPTLPGRGLDVDLIGQFIVCRSAAQIPREWEVRNAGQWLLGSHSKLPILQTRDREDIPIGWLLGHPIHPNLGLLSSISHVSLDCSVADGPAEFERALYEIGGRFAAIYLTPPASRFYLDPCGNLSAVFCPEEHIAASTPDLIPQTQKTPENHELVREIGIPVKDGWYPFGLTPRVGVERLLPNHYLDLETWQTVRHWPRPADLMFNKDVPGAIAEIASILERQIAAVTRVAPVYMPLTGGRHTRMLLACARDYLPRIRFFTIPVPDTQADLDCEIGRRIATRFRLKYVPLIWEEPTPTELNEWMCRVGSCVAGRTWRTVRTLRQLDRTRPILSGQLGAVGEREYWRDGDFEKRHFASALLLERIRMPIVQTILDRADRWLQGLPVGGLLWALDFLHLEIRYGCWAGPQEYGHTDSAFVLSPYCHRRIVQLMLTLPQEYRWRDKLPRDLIGSRWSQLLDFPINALPLRRQRIKNSRGAAWSAIKRILSGYPRVG